MCEREERVHVKERQKGRMNECVREGVCVCERERGEKGTISESVCERERRARKCVREKRV